MKKYQVIYLDPPWKYKNKKTGGSMKSGADNKYPTMSMEELKALEIPADKDAVMYMWVTVPFLQEGLELMKHYGFKYKTMLTWRKIMSLGLGFWYRGQTEHLLFGVRGKVKAFRMQKANIIQTKAGEHSTKPEEFRILIEESTKHMPLKLEMFARRESDGWDVFGNQVNNSINLQNI